jgi:hypothetical protein
MRTRRSAAADDDHAAAAARARLRGDRRFGGVGARCIIWLYLGYRPGEEFAGEAISFPVEGIDGSSISMLTARIG